MELEQIIYEKQGNVATITLNRPDKLNTVTREMFTSWGRAITMAEEDDEVKVIVFKGLDAASAPEHRWTRLVLSTA